MKLYVYQIRTRRTAVYPGQGELDGLLYAALGLGEAGEIQNKVKKILRDDDGKLTEDRREQLIDELGDLLYYVARMADELDVSLATVARNNLRKLLYRKYRGTLKGDGDNR